MSVAYTLQSDDPPRPLSVTVNGQVATASLSFPATGSWSEWGKVLTKVTLFSGQNSITLTALGNSGANLDYIELFPQGHASVGTATVEVDNQFEFFVNEQKVGAGST